MNQTFSTLANNGATSKLRNKSIKKEVNTFRQKIVKLMLKKSKTPTYLSINNL